MIRSIKISTFVLLQPVINHRLHVRNIQAFLQIKRSRQRVTSHKPEKAYFFPHCLLWCDSSAAAVYNGGISFTLLKTSRCYKPKSIMSFRRNVSHNRDDEDLLRQQLALFQKEEYITNHWSLGREHHALKRLGATPKE